MSPNYSRVYEYKQQSCLQTQQLSIKLQMNNNVSQFEKKFRTKDLRTIHTTNMTCDSFDGTFHFLTVLTRLLLPKVTGQKKVAFNLIKNNKQIDPAVLMFINHCATLIQARFRGYQQRKYYLMFRPVMARFKELLRAVIIGWKTRRVLRSKPVLKKINRMKEEQGKNNLRDVRILKRQLIEQLSELLHKGKWIQFIQHHKNSHQDPKTKIILRSALGTYQKLGNQKVYQKSIKSTPSKQKGHEKNVSQQNNQMQRIIEKEIPIKSLGFYNIPDGAEVSMSTSQNINKKKVVVQKKRANKAKSIENAKQPCNQKKIVQPQSQNDKGAKENSLQTKNNENLNAHNLQVVTVQLPIQQVEIKPEQICRTIKKNLNLMTETQKIKKDRKGIKVTLCSSTVSPESEKCEQKQIKKVVVNPKKSESAKKDSLDEIFSVYESAYSSKKSEIQEKYQEMKKQAKFKI